ncbi:Eukaryotic translation initiation factor 4 gamma 3 [Nymphon striatum]|nr:Eukaryotic translation initiation factor 4 gamma 3 [Nymphon striatum]
MTIVDFMALVRKLPMKKMGLHTFEELAKSLSDRILATGSVSTRIDIICYVYQKSSIKQMERAHQSSSEEITITIRSDNQKLPVNLNMFWSSMLNKVRLQEYVFKWMLQNVKSDKEIFFGGVYGGKKKKNKQRLKSLNGKDTDETDSSFIVKSEIEPKHSNLTRLKLAVLDKTGRNKSHIPPCTTHTDVGNGMKTIVMDAEHHSEFFDIKYAHIDKDNKDLQCNTDLKLNDENVSCQPTIESEQSSSAETVLEQIKNDDATPVNNTESNDDVQTVEEKNVEDDLCKKEIEEKMDVETPDDQVNGSASVTEPDSTEPDSTEPDLTETDLTEPELTEPELTETDLTETDLTEPDLTEQDSTEPDSTEPVDGQSPAYTLKYSYKPDQWSPLNMEGKKKYDRNFLIQLQYDQLSQVKPMGLPNLDVIKDKPTASSPMSSFDFTPGFVQSTGKGKSQIMGQKKSSQSGKSSSMRRINLNLDVKLHQSENAWKPSVLRKTEGSVEENETMVIVGKAREILNKLTPSNFKSLSDDFTKLKINSKEKMEKVIDLLFQKALAEPKFVKEYADLCKNLSTLRLKVSADGQDLKFQSMILSRCQGIFEKSPLVALKKESRQKDISQEKDVCLTFSFNSPSFQFIPIEAQKKASLEEGLTNDEFKAKQQMVGNIRLIAQLYKLNLLTANIIYDCYNKLLHGPHDEMTVELLTILIREVGKHMEQEASEKRSLRFNRQKLTDFYDEVEDMLNTDTNNRNKFMIRDIVELRQNNWVPRKADDGPTTIDNVHRQAAEEEFELAQQRKNSTKRPNDDKMSSRRRVGYSSSQNAGEDGWNTVSTRARHQNSFDPSKLKPMQADENIKLGAGSSFLMWGSGSNGGNRSSTDSNSGMRKPSNRFNALQNSEIEEKTNNSTARSGPPSRDSSVGRQGTASNTRDRSQPPRGGSRERQEAVNSVSNFTRPGTSVSRSKDPGPADDILDTESETYNRRLSNIIAEATTMALNEDMLKDIDSILKPQTAKYFVSTVITKTIEENKNCIKSAACIFDKIFERRMISPEDFANGLVEILQVADDLVVDIPQFWEHMRVYIAPIFKYSSSYEVIKIGARNCLLPLGESRVVSMWQASNLQLKDLLGDANIDKFISNNKLGFLCQSQPNAFDIKFITEELNRLLCVIKASNEEVVLFIENYVGTNNVSNPQFIRALVVAVFKSAMTGIDSNAVLEKDPCDSRACLFHKFISGQVELELEALYAVQQMLYLMNFPSGVVRTCFDFLYDEEIISDETLCQWESNPREMEGHAVLMKSLTAFFIWLNEPEENSVGAVGGEVNSEQSSRHNEKFPPSPQ